MTNEAEAKENKPRLRRVRVGRVVSNNGHKTAAVEVNLLVKHTQYGKYVRRRTKLAVHDENDLAKIGDTVEIVPCRRRSRTKAHRLVRVVRSVK